MKFFEVILGVLILVSCGGPGIKNEQATNQKKEGVLPPSSASDANASSIQPTGIALDNPFDHLIDQEKCQNQKPLDELASLSSEIIIDANNGDWVIDPTLNDDARYKIGPQKIWLGISKFENQNTLAGFLSFEGTLGLPSGTNVYLEFGTIQSAEKEAVHLRSERILRINRDEIAEWRFDRWIPLALTSGGAGINAIWSSPRGVEWQVDLRFLDAVRKEQLWWIRSISDRAELRDRSGTKFFRGDSSTPNQIPNLKSCSQVFGNQEIVTNFIGLAPETSDNYETLSGAVLMAISDFHKMFFAQSAEETNIPVIFSAKDSTEINWEPIDGLRSLGFPPPKILHIPSGSRIDNHFVQSVYMTALGNLNQSPVQVANTAEQVFLAPLLESLGLIILGSRRIPKAVVLSYLASQMADFQPASLQEDIPLLNETLPISPDRKRIIAKSIRLGVLLSTIITKRSLDNLLKNSYELKQKASRDDILKWLETSLSFDIGPHKQVQATLATDLMGGWFEEGTYSESLNPFLTLDLDGDGISDIIEKKILSNPEQADSDHDGWSDLAEYTSGTGITSVGEKPTFLIADQNFGDWEELLPTSIKILADNAVAECQPSARIHAGLALAQGQQLIIGLRNKKDPVQGEKISWEVQIEIPSENQRFSIESNFQDLNYLTSEKVEGGSSVLELSIAPIGVRGAEWVFDANAFGINLIAAINDSGLKYRLISYTHLPSGQKILCTSGPWESPLVNNGP